MTKGNMTVKLFIGDIATKSFVGNTAIMSLVGGMMMLPIINCRRNRACHGLCVIRSGFIDISEI